MPKMLFTNDAVKESVTRPIVFDIARQVQEWTGLTDVNILFHGDSEVALQPGSTIDNEVNFNKTTAGALWRVSVREEHRPEKLLATAVHQQEHDEYFIDEAIGFYLRPVYSPTILTLDFEYRSTDVNAARRWRDEYRAKLSNNRDVRTHTINYHYLVPKEFFPLIEHMHELREAQAGYGEDLMTYLKNHFTQNVTEVTTMTGTQGRWAIAEQQARCVGQFAFAELPDDNAKQGDGSTYRQTFSYTVYYDCPIATSASYPILVHNQVVDGIYLPYEVKDDIDKFDSRSPRSVTALGAFEVFHLARPTIKSGIRLPYYHEFMPKSVPNSTLQVLSALVGIENPDDPEVVDNRKIMSFSELDEKWEFLPEFLEFLKRDHAYLNRYGESLVNVTVYVGDMPLHHSKFTVTEDLDVVLVDEPSLRKTYYVRLALLTDPSELSRPAKDRAREEAEVVTLIGAALCPRLISEGKLPKVLGNSNYLTRAEGEAFFDNLRMCTIGHNGGVYSDHAIIQMNTVMCLLIETDHIDAMNEQEQ